MAFRALDRRQDVRYVAADLSDEMLARAKRRATQRQPDQIRFVNVDMRELPFDDDCADLCLSYSGPHAGVDPATVDPDDGFVLFTGRKQAS